MRNLKRSRVVLTPDAELPYKVVLEHADGTCSEHPVPTVREGEVLIRAHGSPQFTDDKAEVDEDCPLLHGID